MDLKTAVINIWQSAGKALQTRHSQSAGKAYRANPDLELLKFAEMKIIIKQKQDESVRFKIS